MNFEPIIESIAKLIGATERAAARGRRAHTSADVERWLGSLSAPERQVPLVHDYLRGADALAEAEASGATHVRDVSVPVWQSAQRRLQSQVDADPEVQQAIRNLYVGRNSPIREGVSEVPLAPGDRQPDPTSVEVPAEARPEPQARPRPPREALTEEQRRQQEDAWNEFIVATEEQDAPRIDTALERIRALHPESEPANPAGTTEQAPGWRRALDYMASLEQQVEQMQAAKVPNEAWSKALEDWRRTQGIDDVALPKHTREAVARFEAWADSAKPPSLRDQVGDILGVPRSIQSSIDFSAPGRQGILMIGRPEYFRSFRPMFEAWDAAKFKEQEAYIRAHPDFGAAQDAGLALTGLHAKFAPREEAFQSRLAERIPGLGKYVKSSEQAYSTFLNRLRLDVFSNELRAAGAAGVDVGDQKFLRDLAEWINTATGRGGGKGFNPGVLSTVLYSPRLAWARLQTLNPLFYARLHPRVRAAAIRQNLTAAAVVWSLVSLAGMAGAKVTWDFRNPDAGKVRIGNTRLDLGGGHFQFIRLFVQIASGEKVSPETGKVTKLGEKFGEPTRLDLVTRFIISKEAPVASFATDWLRGKDATGRPFKLDEAIISRVTPLLMQDMYDALMDDPINALFYLVPATFGIGVQTHRPISRPEYVPFIGVRGEVPEEKIAEYRRMIEEADKAAATEAAVRTAGKSPAATRAVLRALVSAGRLRVRAAWIKANQEAFRKARAAGEKTVPLQAPAEPDGTRVGAQP